MIRKFFILLIPILYMAGGSATGQDKIFILDSARRNQEEIRDFIKYYYSENMPDNISGIMNINPAEFIDFNQKKLSGLNSYWLRFTTKNNSGHNLNLWLIVGMVDYFKFYSPADSLKPVVGGNMTPAKNLSLGSRGQYSVPISLHSGQTKTYYLWVKGAFHGSPALFLHLTNAQEMAEITNRHNNNFWQGIFHGILWVMIVYNIFFTVIGKDKTYLFYALYMISVSIYFLDILGYLQEYVFPNQPILGNYILLIMQLGVIFYLVFVQKFLSLDKILPLWNKICNYLIVATFILLVIKASYFLIFSKFGIFVYVSQLAVILGALLTVGLIIALYRSKSILARYFMIGSIALGTGLVMSSLMSFSREAFSPAYFSSIQLGVIFEILFFSIGLSYKISENEREKTKAQQKLIVQLQENERLQANYARELEDRVEERTREITERQSELERQTEKLEELNEEKNHLIGIVAHDLRNPLTSALSLVKYLKENPENNKQDFPETIGIVNSSLERMNSMIDKILDIRAIESQTLNVVYEEIHLPEFLYEIINNFSAKAESKSIRILKDIEPVVIRSDRHFLTEIVENLISNALKFSPEGKEVRISACRNDKKIVISVTDQGPGFTEQDKKLLFLKYQRLSAKPTHGESSTGLGLSIVKKFIEKLNGNIELDSESGKGSTFNLIFGNN